MKKFNLKQMRVTESQEKHSSVSNRIQGKRNLNFNWGSFTAKSAGCRERVSRRASLYISSGHAFKNTCDLIDPDRKLLLIRTIEDVSTYVDALDG